MDQSQDIHSNNVTQLVRRYEKYNGDNKMKIRTMIRILFEIQELRIQVYRMLEQIRFKEQTVLRLTKQQLRR